MSRVQTIPNGYVSINRTGQRVSALERRNNSPTLIQIDSAGMSSAQIDVAVFGAGQQPYDGAQTSDPTNNLLLVRQAGKWAQATLTVIP